MKPDDNSTKQIHLQIQDNPYQNPSRLLLQKLRSQFLKFMWKCMFFGNSEERRRSWKTNTTGYQNLEYSYNTQDSIVLVLGQVYDQRTKQRPEINPH